MRFQKKRFLELLDISAKENPQSDKSFLYTLVKKKNLETFTKQYNEASQWLAPHPLMQNKELAYILKKTQETKTAPAYANVYVQKKFQVVLSGNTIIDDSSSNYSENILHDENGNIFFIRE